MAGSGHIAGVVNPPASRNTSTGRTGRRRQVRRLGRKAKETPGSWWPDWLAWLTAQAPEKVPARKPGDGKLKPLGDAPGDYVRVKA